MLSAFDVSLLPDVDRPRERLFSKGADSLTSIELLAILLGSGSKNNKVLEIATSMISKSDGLRGISKLSPNEILNFKGIGKSKAATISACFEITRRLSGYEKIQKQCIIDTKDLYSLLKPILLNKVNERFIVVSLDSRRKVISLGLISKGTVNQTLVHPREVFREAIINNASFIALAHNHPSGEHSPSHDDISITKRLLEVSKTIGIPIIDHIIVSDNGYVSIISDCTV